MTTERKRTNSRVWTKEEEDFLKRVYEDMQYTVAEISEAIDRTATAVHKRAKILGLSRCNPYVNKVTMEGHRICATCKQELPLELFTKNKGKRYGVEASCKACVKLKKLQKEENKKKQQAQKEMPTKACSMCGIIYDNTDEFYSWYSKRSVYSTTCKKCNSEKMRLTAEENYRVKGYKK